MTSSSTMQATLYAQIKAELRRYLRGLVSLHDFNEWFVRVGWQVENADDALAEDLVYDITLYLAEYSAGQWTEDELAGKLRTLESEAKDLNIKVNLPNTMPYGIKITGIDSTTASA